MHQSDHMPKKKAIMYIPKSIVVHLSKKKHTAGCDNIIIWRATLAGPILSASQIRTPNFSASFNLPQFSGRVLAFY
jgi:hypothetical protein